MRRGAIVCVALAACFLAWLGRRADALKLFDISHDGAVQASELVAVFLGTGLGHLSWAASAARDALGTLFTWAGAGAILATMGAAWLLLRSLAFALVSRLVVTFELEDDELCHSLMRSAETGQLEGSQHLRLGKSVTTGTSTPMPTRAIRLEVMQPWRRSQHDDSGAPHEDTFELEIDRRFASRLCVWNSEDGSVRAGSALGALRELGCMLLSAAPRTRIFFLITSQHGGSGSSDEYVDALLSVTLLRTQREALWALLEQSRKDWHSAREGVTHVRRLAPSPHPGMSPYFPSSGETEPRRGIESFAMPSDETERRQLQSVLDDYRDFVGRMRWYSARGVPYRRGYLFHGSPRCGKTHFAKVLAGRTSSDLYVIDLASASSLGINDDNISDILRALPPRSVLLLKNIDGVVSARGAKDAAAAAATPDDDGQNEDGPEGDGRSSTDEAEGESDESESEHTGGGGLEDEAEEKLGYSAVLNALDGALANNQGLTIVMSTNQYDKLMKPEFKATREALFRPGRVDLQCKLSRPDERQITVALHNIFGGEDGSGDSEGQLEAAAKTLLQSWPMTKADADAAGKENVPTRRSLTSFAALKGHLMRYAHKRAADACAPTAVQEFRMRVLAGTLERAEKVALAAIKSLHSARARVALHASGALGGSGPDAKSLVRLSEKVKALHAPKARLSRALASVDDDQSPLLKESVVSAKRTLRHIEREIAKGAVVEKAPEDGRSQAAQAHALRGARAFE
jgi:SpoVK/Ycf46/Vps4 family AAA+-type ATPase